MMKIKSGAPRKPIDRITKPSNGPRSKINGFDKAVISNSVESHSLKAVVERVRVRIKNEGLKGKDEVSKAIIKEVLSPNIKGGVSEKGIDRLVERIYDTLKDDPSLGQWLRKFMAIVGD